MEAGSTIGISIRFRQAAIQKHCPECGCLMKEVHRCNENGAVFVWYECERNDCNGQWLQKIFKEA